MKTAIIIVAAVAGTLVPLWLLGAVFAEAGVSLWALVR